MGLRIEERAIGAFTFKVQQLPYLASQRLLIRLLRIVGPSITELLALIGSKKMSSREAMESLFESDTDKLAPVLGSVFGRLEPAEAEEITKAILFSTHVEIENKKTQVMEFHPLVKMLDAVLAGDFWTGLKVQAFALSVHFGNFSGASVESDPAALAVSPSLASNT